MNNTQYIKKFKKDFAFIFKSFNDAKFIYNENFTKKTNRDFEDIIITDILTTKLEGAPRTETILRLHSIKDISVKQKKPFLSFLTKQKGSIEVTIRAVVDYYWIVDGQESSVPGEILKNEIYKNKELAFNLRYREINNQIMLVYFWDDNGCDFGESRIWPGKPRLMKEYRKNPNLIN